ncbi:zona pellucida glycoprotein 3f, tandem duplicate 2 [Denticeps clupeoides]|uniref:zona pellucida glycoprotein 3f, tandem duplicate 2 n=1 Tax=Denticeps clupeoides TaxID=299321 RepID=UPI0010A461DC|nr:uncharacterized protein LOC114787894 [Denticeps clupeoides]
MCLWFGVIIWTLTERNDALSNDDIQIECGKDFMSVKWMVDEELSAHPNRLFLGLCYPSQFTALPGGGQAVFNFSFHDCHIRPVASPAYGKIQANSNLNFHMGLLNEDLSGPAESNTFAVGSFIPIWASVEQQFHQPLLLLLEECVASTSLALMPGAPVYPIITNMGCLVDGKGRGSRFLPRHQTYAILLYLQAFEFAAGKDIYIHCKLMAWDPAALDFGKKACNYNNQSESWEMLDDPSRNSLCSCCDSNCVYRTKRGAASVSLQDLALLRLCSELTLGCVVLCLWPSDWMPPVYEPVMNMYGLGKLDFSLKVMNDDFSSQTSESVFRLGSLIPISASVDQQAHQPLLLLLDECVASTTPEIGPESQIYPFITNKGCFVDSAKTESKFLPRQRPSELRFYLQAFKFAQGNEVYVHCMLLAWDNHGFGEGMKACHHVKKTGSWELLDNPTRSSLCNCCDYGGDYACASPRRKRELAFKGVSQRAVLGPLRIAEDY